MVKVTVGAKQHHRCQAACCEHLLQPLLLLPAVAAAVNDYALAVIAGNYVGVNLYGRENSPEYLHAVSLFRYCWLSL